MLAVHTMALLNLQLQHVFHRISHTAASLQRLRELKRYTE
jgi:hypothetical protein